MLSIFDPLRGIGFTALLFRLFLAVLCGTFIGLDRSAKNRAAGFRTHILVCLGAATAAVTGHFLYLGLHLPTDITRLGGQIITGLGFIGAGTIIVTKQMTIKGLTTAAGLWTTGIIGLALGSGFYEAGLIGTLLVFFTESCLAKLGLSNLHRAEFTAEILYDTKDSLDQVMRCFKDERISIKNLKIHTPTDGITKYTASLDLQANRKFSGRDLKKLIEKISSISGVKKLEAHIIQDNPYLHRD